MSEGSKVEALSCGHTEIGLSLRLFGRQPVQDRVADGSEKLYLRFVTAQNVQRSPWSLRWVDFNVAGWRAGTSGCG